MPETCLDLRLYSRTGVFEAFGDAPAERADPVTADAPAATEMEIEAGKVVKFLLTAQGSDAFNPEYGGTALHDAQVAESHIPALRLDVQNDLARCADSIRRAEQGLPTGRDRLASLFLAGVEYGAADRPGQLAVRIEIVTTAGKRALVALPVGSHG